MPKVRDAEPSDGAEGERKVTSFAELRARLESRR
jgi:hypothetical protein